MRTNLPAALVPPTRAVGASLTARSSLTIATLHAINDGVPFHLSTAADISAHRAYFHAIPGVLS